jgi:hypothetical protein
MNRVLKSMAIGLSLIVGSQAMDAPETKDVGGRSLITQGQTARDLTPTEKKNAYKMWLLKEHFEKSNKEGTLPAIPKDIRTVIGRTLHELSANPVLDGDLVYTDKDEKRFFKIMSLIKNDWCMDLSSKNIFGDSSNYLLITTAPEAFFRIVDGSIRLVILIAPKFLIEEKIETTAKTFLPIMANWNEEQAPIGIFYRMERCNDLNWFDYLTTDDMLTISKNSLYENWLAATIHPGRALRREFDYNACKKFRVYL